MKNTRYSFLQQDIKNLAKSFIQYSHYLDNKNREIADNHRSLIPVRSMQTQKGITISVLEKNSAWNEKNNSMDDRLIRSKYQSVKNALSNVNIYEPIDLRAFAPDEKRARHKYYRNLRLPFAVEVFEKIHGNNQEKVMSGWRIPELFENRCQT